MKAFNNDINQKIATYFMDRLDCRQASTGWLRAGTCPHCEEVGKYGVNVWLNRTNCFKCGYHQKPIDVIMAIEGFQGINEFNKFIDAFEGADLLDKPVEFLHEKVGNLPESYKLIVFGDSLFGKLARKYLRGRGYNINKLALRGIGYCTQGSYKGRIITPFYENGFLVYFNARKFIEVGDKHKNPKTEEFGIGKSLIMYNVDCLHLYNRVFLVESATNALTLGDRSFAIGGKQISKYQLSKIIKSPCKEVVIILDRDAYWYSLKLALDLIPHKRIRVIKMPVGQDVNDIGKKKTMELIKKSKVLSYREVYELFLNEDRPIHFLPTA